MNNGKSILRERRLMHLFMVLNVGLAGAFVVYLVISRQHESPLPFAGVLSQGAVANAPRPSSPAVPPADPSPEHEMATPVSRAALQSASASAEAAPTPAATAATVLPASDTNRSARTFTWQNLESPDYRRYIQNLRAIGCPEETVRRIVLEDINRLFNHRRLQIAVASDIAWWRPQPEYLFANPLREPGRRLEEQRRSLIASLLGTDTPEAETEPMAPWSSVPLTGAVLGSMSTEKHNLVQEICAKALERQQGLELGPFNGGPPASPVEAARSRDQTRTELRQVMDPNELEEFLLRYSQVARNLRAELAVANPTEAEFRKVFRAVDPLEHQMQREFGGLETMSQQQRERYDRQRDTAIREALGAERYEACRAVRDPLYATAQAMAQARNAPPEALLPIFRLAKTTEARLQEIRSDTTLTPEEKSRAISAVNQEQAESLEKIVRGTVTPGR